MISTIAYFLISHEQTFYAEKLQLLLHLTFYKSSLSKIKIINFLDGKNHQRNFNLASFQELNKRKISQFSHSPQPRLCHQQLHLPFEKFFMVTAEIKVFPSLSLSLSLSVEGKTICDNNLTFFPSLFLPSKCVQ